MKYALITGAAGGIGSATAKRAIDGGFFVFGLDVAEKCPIESHNFCYIKCNITSDESVENAKAEVLKTTDHLDCIVNIAGVMTMGSFIEKPASVFQRMMDINVIGMCRVNNVFFPLAEKCKGRIINFSSEYGTYTTVPFNGFYTATKHAVEVYSDGLRRELRYIGMDVATVRPGAFRTNMEKSTADIFDKLNKETTHYKTTLAKITPMLTGSTKKTKDVSIIAEVTYKAMTDVKLKRVYKSNHNLSVKLVSLLPAKLVDFIFYTMFKQD